MQIVTGEPEGKLARASEKYKVDAEEPARINATMLALVRNNEVDAMVRSMVDLERTWNHKFNYPWTFFNDEPFSEEFKKKTSGATKAKCRYGMPPNVVTCVLGADCYNRADSRRAMGDAQLD